MSPTKCSNRKKATRKKRELADLGNKRPKKLSIWGNKRILWKQVWEKGKRGFGLQKE